VIWLKSIFSRIIFLHVIAVLITAIFMPLVLYWFMSSAANDLHNQAMRKQADAIAQYLVPRAEGGWTFNLPVDLHDLYSEAYGRYAYAVLDEKGRTLFSSRADKMPIFELDSHAAEIEYLNIRRGNKIIAGASARKQSAGRTIWVQVAEDLAHQDVIIDDIVADFFQRVGWVTLPILLVLLAIDIFIFRRAMIPLIRASEEAQHISPAKIDVADRARNSERNSPAGDGGQRGARSARKGSSANASSPRTPRTSYERRLRYCAPHRDLAGSKPPKRCITTSKG
jgi:hypothetical protein